MEVVYEDPHSPEFLEEVILARNILPLEKMETFFKGTMFHFLDYIPENVGLAILETLAILFHKSNTYIKYFVEHKYTAFLPFHQKNLTDALLDVLYEISLSIPGAFDETVTDLFGRMIVRRPNKSLIIIYNCISKFKGKGCQWRMLNLLIYGVDRFDLPESELYYTRLLLYCLQTIPYFFEQQSTEAYSCFVKFLQSDDPATIKNTYAGMSYIASKNQNLPMPFFEVSMHIRHKEVRDAALDFLLVAPLFSSDKITMKLVENLLLIAETDKRASLVLMRLAEDENVSLFLLSHSQWMSIELPTKKHTMKLFLVVFSHVTLRPDIAKAEYFIDFLFLMANWDESGALQLINKIVRRAGLTIDLVDVMSRRNVIASFLATADIIGSSKAQYLAILFMDTISQVCYTREMRPYTNVLMEIIKNEHDNFDAAMKLAIELCQYKKCKEKFISLGLYELVEQRKPYISNQKLAKKIISLLKP